MVKDEFDEFVYTAWGICYSRSNIREASKKQVRCLVCPRPGQIFKNREDYNAHYLAVHVASCA